MRHELISPWIAVIDKNPVYRSEIADALKKIGFQEPIRFNHPYSFERVASYFDAVFLGPDFPSISGLQASVRLKRTNDRLSVVYCSLLAPSSGWGIDSWLDKTAFIDLNALERMDGKELAKHLAEFTHDNLGSSWKSRCETLGSVGLLVEPRRLVLAR